jgi:RNA polymerase sigma factor (TIGR02999 family)
MAEAFTILLQSWRDGDVGARDRLIALAWPELSAIARRQLAGERAGHTLQPTALVNEAYLRLSGLDRIDWQDRVHFVRLAARIMREVLVDHARRRAADKRDGGQKVSLTVLEGSGEAVLNEDVDAALLDDALTRLAQVDPVRAQVVELRYFGGLNIEEAAEAMELSPATVKRHWVVARAWLYDALAER